MPRKLFVVVRKVDSHCSGGPVHRIVNLTGGKRLFSLFDPVLRPTMPDCVGEGDCSEIYVEYVPADINEERFNIAVEDDDIVLLDGT